MGYMAELFGCLSTGMAGPRHKGNAELTNVDYFREGEAILID